MIIEKITSNIKDTDIGLRQIDNVWVTHEDLMKPHQKLVSENGNVVKISLSDGQKLTCGDILYQDDSTVTVINLEDERVFEIIPKSAFEFAKVAFNIGNMHQKLYIYDNKLRVPYDYVLERLMETLNVEWRIIDAKLDGQLANVSYGHGHTHSHEHHHHHHHDHEGGHSHE